ncbi:MAG: hypothetical protein JWQ74_2944 [Marmoricola sp.]|nr:hypothetical protein [Marmoricola sp.]
MPFTESLTSAQSTAMCYVLHSLGVRICSHPGR